MCYIYNIRNETATTKEQKMIGNIENLKKRYHAVLITLADLRQDLKAIGLGLKTDFSKEETTRLAGKYSQSANDLRSAIDQLAYHV